MRHFSSKVCAKVQEKGRTTYNEVADELVRELTVDPKSAGNGSGSDVVMMDEKNIRRRVYDALNVLMAMEIIVKEKKEIIWSGLPRSAGAIARGNKNPLTVPTTKHRRPWEPPHINNTPQVMLRVRVVGRVVVFPHFRPSLTTPPYHPRGTSTSSHKMWRGARRNWNSKFRV